jgi:hypothetical protein
MVLLQRLIPARGFLKVLVHFGCLIDLLLPILFELLFSKLDGLLVTDAPRVGRNYGSMQSGRYFLVIVALTIEFTCIWERSGQMSGATIYYTFLSFYSLNGRVHEQ